MNTAQLLEQLGQLSDVERLEVIEAATRLTRKNLAAGKPDGSTDPDRRMSRLRPALRTCTKPVAN